MNAKRRKILNGIISELESIKSLVSIQYDKLNTEAEEENDTWENMPEGLQQSERGEIAEQAADDLTNAAYELNEIESVIDSVITEIDSGIGEA